MVLPSGEMALWRNQRGPPVAKAMVLAENASMRDKKVFFILIYKKHLQRYYFFVAFPYVG